MLSRWTSQQDNKDYMIVANVFGYSRLDFTRWLWSLTFNTWSLDWVSCMMKCIKCQLIQSCGTLLILTVTNRPWKFDHTNGVAISRAKHRIKFLRWFILIDASTDTTTHSKQLFFNKHSKFCKKKGKGNQYLYEHFTGTKKDFVKTRWP